MNPASCHSSRVTVSTTDNYDFATSEPVFVYTDIIKPNLVGDPYVRVLTSLHLPSTTGYYAFNYPPYRRIEQSFIESIATLLVTKNGNDVVFDDSGIPCLVVLNFKKKNPRQ